MKLSYNSPVVLTFTLVSLVELLLQEFLSSDIQLLFSVYTFSIDNPITYFQLISHAIGHSNWEHFLSNFSFILLLGPLIEEKYGSTKLLILIFVTSLITGMLFIMFFDGRLLGASGIVFMLIILSSFSSPQQGKIPLTFILVSIIYLGREIFNSLNPNQISEFAHILGGICGGIFGFYVTTPNDTKEPTKESNTENTSIDQKENGIDHY